jgi:hypothetical protein
LLRLATEDCGFNRSNPQSAEAVLIWPKKNLPRCPVFVYQFTGAGDNQLGKPETTLAQAITELVDQARADVVLIVGYDFIGALACA